jgi:2-C-methyl-D-erythritol 4-phosphate cytidylyltransferase
MTQRILNIIVAAGSGSRFGADRPKQFCLLQNCMVLHHAIKRIKAATPGSHTVVVMSRDWADAVDSLGCTVAIGGATRWHSVKNALDATADVAADVITVHDGARPLPSAAMIERVIAACSQHHGAIPVIPVTDSLRRVDGSPANRADFRAVQTPQAFCADLLRRAYDVEYRPEFTDDASVMTAAGYTDIALVDGDPMNLKITLPMDIEIANVYLQHGAGR